MITCQECRERLNDLLDETSVSSKDRALRDFRAHVAGCAACTHDLALLRAAQSELRAMPEVPAPAAVRSRVLAALEAEKTAPKRGFGAAFEAFLQRPTRLAWAGGVLATACFLVILARTPQIQDSTPQFGESASRREKVAAPAQDKPKAQTLEPARQSAAAAPKKPAGKAMFDAPISAKVAEARSGDAPAIAKTPSPMSPRSTAPQNVLRAKTSNTTQNFSDATNTAAGAPSLTRRLDDADSIARGPLVPELTSSLPSVPRAFGQARTPNAAILPNRKQIVATPQIAEATQPSPLRVRDANASEAVSPTLGAPAVSLQVPLTNRIAKLARPEEGALAAGAAGNGPVASPKAALGGGAALSLAVPSIRNGTNDVPLLAQSNAATDSVQAAIPAPPAGLSSAPGLSARVPAKPNAHFNSDNVASANGVEQKNAPILGRSGAGNSYMMRQPQGLPGIMFPGGARSSGGGFGVSGAKGDRGEAPPTAAKTADERKDDKQEERQVLLLSIARDVTFNFMPTRDWRAVQLRLVLPPALRFADGKTSKILWHGAAQKGQKVSVTTSLLARETGACQLRLILEQSAGGTVLPVQTQTIAVDVVR